MEEVSGPKIVVSQAGHINSGGFEDFTQIAEIAKRNDAWVHVDGAFGLWARVLPEKATLTRGLELADSWSVDGHKWLQIPYDSGFAIVKDEQAHRRAMDITAGYLNQSPEDGRNPTEYNPELSRRARGFAAWAVLRAAGRQGVREIVARHCGAAERLAGKLSDISGFQVVNRVQLNQVVVSLDVPADQRTAVVAELAQLVNATQRVFVRPAEWQGETVLRFSVISGPTGKRHIDGLVEVVERAWNMVRAAQ